MNQFTPNKKRILRFQILQQTSAEKGRAEPAEARASYLDPVAESEGSALPLSHNCKHLGLLLIVQERE